MEINNDVIEENPKITSEQINDKSSKSRKKKKKNKKSTTESKANTNEKKDNLDEIVEFIFSEIPSTTKICSVPKCKTSRAVMDFTCQYCNMKYCMAHRHPEAHSPKCVEKARNAAHSNFKQESIRVISQERSNPGSINAKGFSVDKSKEELKKRYKEKLDKARRNERGGL
ncbi:7306_t:CDS:2 [Funneliformis caledonium]|uniref:7306_t:CDS:1 n=1 Tax=Funneliformis caledonium TaxID=1117310 RepID=A0A9N9FUQ1_9GLOM|nr:7306_t:CDS:2 [Funneliformis caledonium]